MLSEDLTYSLIHCEAMVDASWQCDHVPLVHGDAYPTILLVPDIKVGLPVNDVADLIVQMQMFFKEHLELVIESQEEVLTSQYSKLDFVNPIKVIRAAAQSFLYPVGLHSPCLHSWAVCPCVW